MYFSKISQFCYSALILAKLQWIGHSFQKYFTVQFVRTQRIVFTSQRHLVGTGVAENYNSTLIKTVGVFYHHPLVMHDKYPNDKMYRVRSSNLRYCQEKYQE